LEKPGIYNLVLVKRKIHSKNESVNPTVSISRRNFNENRHTLSFFMSFADSYMDLTILVWCIHSKK
jgi:hypothetical protein